MHTQRDWIAEILFAFIIVWAAVMCSGAIAQENVCDFPRNNKFIAPIEASGVRYKTFRAAIAAVQNAYAPIVAAHGAKLVINDMWSEGEVNAQAYRIGNEWHVDAFGGLARYPGMNKGGYLTVLCHEVGHHLGGLPRYNRNTDWASVEGQADYWAESCMRAVAPSLARSGAQSLGNVLADLNGERAPNFSTPDPSRVSRTYEGHPRAQCRLDTYLAGIKRWLRPACWYAG